MRSRFCSWDSFWPPVGGAPVLRLVKTLYFGTIVNWVVLAMVLLAATRLAEPFLLWDEWLPNLFFHSIRQVIEWLGISFSFADAGVGTQGDSLDQ